MIVELGDSMRLSFSAFVLGLGLSSTAGAQETQDYSYDVHGRLVGVVRAAGTTTRTTSYTLDKADNRSQHTTTVVSGAGMVSQPGAYAEASGAEAAQSSTGLSTTGELSAEDQAANTASPSSPIL